MKDNSKFLSKIFKSVNELNPEGGTFESSLLSTPSDWIDTGSMALNAIISGSLYKGIPAGRIIGFSGPSQCLTGKQKLKVYPLKKSFSYENVFSSKAFYAKMMLGELEEVFSTREDRAKAIDCDVETLRRIEICKGEDLSILHVDPLIFEKISTLFDSFLGEKTQFLTIPQIISLCETTWFVVDTPDGWKIIFDAFSNGKKPCLSILTTEGEELQCSTEHYVEVIEGNEQKWKFAKELKIGDKLVSKSKESVLVEEVTYLPEQEVFDITVNSPQHRYWCAGISNHNSGKTHIVNKILANAQKKGYVAVIWDSEVAVDKDVAKNVGMDLRRTMYYPVDTVEQCRNQISKFLDSVIEARKENPEEECKFIISLDSLGNLASEKELKDTESNKHAVDMGLKAKAIRSMLRVITYKAAKAQVPFLFTNHIYEDPSSLFPQQVKFQSGGKGPIYLASILVQLSTTLEKISENEDKEAIGIASNISGVTINALTVKNRLIPPFLKTQLYLNFKTGLHLTAGLFDLAEKMGVIEREGKTYKLVATGENLGFRSKFEEDEAIWLEKINPFLEEKLNAELKYKSEAVDES